jgi:nitrite reductase/ring-hydroxylating ferredoxin subunit
LGLRQDVVLTDGTTLGDCFDLDARKIKAKVFADHNISRLELTRVFGRTWNFVGLDSEIPSPGDYVTRLMGGDSVIVTRDKTGAVNVLLNSCTHRGTQLSVIDRGTCERFKCPYHGWTFDAAGRLQALVAERERLGPDGRKDAFDLRRARVARYSGLIFATWNAEAPDFDTYLGDARWYLDMLFNSVDDDLVVVGPPQRWVVDCDWKQGAENFAGDAYHAPTSHGSAVDIGIIPPQYLNGALRSSLVADTTYGHSIILFNLAGMTGAGALDDEALRQFELPWLPPEVFSQLDSHLSKDQLGVLRDGYSPGVGTLFPNFSWLMQSTFYGPLCSVRTWNPIGFGKVEIWNWVLMHPASSEQLRASIASGYSRQFGIGGLLEQDDSVIWGRMHRAHRGGMGGEQNVDYSRGRVPDETPWPGPGAVWHAGSGPGAVADDGIWNFHLRWYELMTQA